MGLRKCKKTRKGKACLSRHRNLLKTQVNDGFGPFSQRSATLEPFQGHINVQRQINEELVSRTFDIEISEEDIGTEESDCFINNISSICHKTEAEVEWLKRQKTPINKEERVEDLDLIVEQDP